MMGQKYSEYIEDCLHRLDLGEDLLEVLAVYPDCQEKLKPLLLVAMASRSFPVPVPNHTAQRLGKNQLLEEMEIMRSQGAFRKNTRVPPAARLVGNLVSAVRARGFSRLAPSYRLAMVALVLVMSGGFLTLNASAASQPGDLLYNLKLGMERVQLALTFSAESSPDNSEQTTKEDVAPRTTNKSTWVIHGIPVQFSQDGGSGKSVAAVTQPDNSPILTGSPHDFDVMEETTNEQVTIADAEPKIKDKDEDKDKDEVKGTDKDKEKDSAEKDKADEKLKSKEEKLKDKDDKKDPKKDDKKDPKK